MPRFSNIMLTLASLLVGFFMAELALRTLLFNDFALSSSLRDPRYFADNSSDDYWKLRHRWGHRSPWRTHPLLGWLSNSIDPDDFSHKEAGNVGARRPVLLYGDSFAQGVRGAQPFQHFLNRDEAFGETHYLLNYGVGGYGLDQIYLLFKNSVDLYDDPVVVFSLLVGDINRSMLSVRGGQKPYFELVNGRLELRGIPIDPDSDGYFARHPPQIQSYFWNLFLYRTDNPGPIRSYLRKKEAKKKQKMDLNGAILSAVYKELTDRHLDFTILVFRDSTFRWNATWQDAWVKDQLEEMEVDYIWAPDILHREAAERPTAELFLPDGHPNSVSNQIIAREIKHRVLASTRE